MADAQDPQPGHAPGTIPTAPHGQPPAPPPAPFAQAGPGRGTVVLHQAYPGAPPTPAPDGPAATYPPPPGGARSGLAVTALVLGILCVVFGLIPVVGTVLLAPLVVATATFAIIALSRPEARRARPMVALALAATGILLTVWWYVAQSNTGPWLWGNDRSAEVSENPGAPFEPEAPEPEAGLPPLLGVEGADGGASRSDALPYGTTVTIVDENTGDEVWSLTVGAPEDATAAASSDAEPENGGYVAVPVELTNLSDTSIDPARDYEYALYAWLLTGDGGRADPTYLTGDAGYLGSFDLDEVAPGATVEYFEVFDVAPTVTATGFLVFDLPEGGQLFWGPAQ